MGDVASEAVSAPGTDLRGAIQALEDQLANTPRAARPYEHAAVCYRLGLAYAESPVDSREANLRKALACFDTAAGVFDARFDPVEHARVLNAAGAVHRALGDRRKAAELFDKAGTLFEGHERDDERAAALNNLGLVRSELGELAAAIAAFDEAAPLFDIDHADGRRGLSSVLHNRGLARAAAGTVEGLRAAIVDYEEARSVVDREDAAYHHALVDHSIGVAASGLADLDAEHRAQPLSVAIEALSNALSTFTRTAFPFQHALASHNLGRAFAATGDLVQLRRAVMCFEDSCAVLDPRMHAELWRHAHASLERAEAELASRTGGPVSRPANFTALVSAVPAAERILLLRGRLGRLLLLPPQSRDAALFDLAAASSLLPPDQALGYITAEIIVLMELPNEGLEAALTVRMAAHGRLEPDEKLEADRALDQSVGDALGLSQRMLVRDHLASLGFERP